MGLQSVTFVDKQLAPVHIGGAFGAVQHQLGAVEGVLAAGVAVLELAQLLRVLIIIPLGAGVGSVDAEGPFGESMVDQIHGLHGVAIPGTQNGGSRIRIQQHIIQADPAAFHTAPGSTTDGGPVQDLYPVALGTGGNGCVLGAGAGPDADTVTGDGAHNCGVGAGGAVQINMVHQDPAIHDSAPVAENTENIQPLILG